MMRAAHTIRLHAVALRAPTGLPSIEMLAGPAADGAAEGLAMALCVILALRLVVLWATANGCHRSVARSNFPVTGAYILSLWPPLTIFMVLHDLYLVSTKLTSFAIFAARSPYGVSKTRVDAI